MLEFQRVCPCQRERFEAYFEGQPEKGCEYSLVNLMAWGRQRVHFGDTLMEQYGILLLNEFLYVVDEILCHRAVFLCKFPFDFGGQLNELLYGNLFGAHVHYGVLQQG